MRQIGILLLVWGIMINSISSYCQSVTSYKSNVKWTVNPFDNRFFIENKGQFDDVLLPDSGKAGANYSALGMKGEGILYAAHIGNIWTYFSKNGFTYRYDEYPARDKSATGDPDQDGPIKTITHYLNVTWQLSDTNVSVEGVEKQSQYYTYPQGNNGTIKTNVFRKIMYKNIYPFIDVEFKFPEGKPGLEYSLILHSGADLSQVKLFYSDAEQVLKNDKGEIIIYSTLNNFTEHLPLSYYEGDRESIPVTITLNGNVESFELTQGYDMNKTVVIDPWQSNPNFVANHDRAYDIDFDNNGNVYAEGSWDPFQLVKMNSAGVIQWTYNATALDNNYYGDFAADRRTGTTYLTDGYAGSKAIVLKVNTLGALVATYPGNTSMNEMWRAEYSPCNDSIVIAGGGTSADNQACMLDTSMTNMNPVNVLGASLSFHDMALLAIDPSGQYCFMASAKSFYGSDPQDFNNYLLKLPIPALSPTIYNVPDGYFFDEVHSNKYVYNTAGEANGMNGMAASPNWLYMYNGDTLSQMNKATGALNSRISIAGGTDYEWGGLDVDACDDVYMGYMDSINIYNAALILQTTLLLPDTVFALKLGHNNLLYACGIGYVSSMTAPLVPKLISTVATVPSACNACNGNATVTINCGIAPFSYVWTNGQTNLKDTGLCEGIYTVTVTDASCPPNTDSAVVTVSSKAGYYVTLIDSNPDCALRPGSITVFPKGGIGPYTYFWSNGETTNRDTGLHAGTYTGTVTDNDGCKYPIIVTLINPTSPTITISPGNDSICSGGNLVITASGGKTYSWAPDSELSCTICPSTTASPTVTITYTVTGADSNGCTATATIHILVIPTSGLKITGKDSVCSGGIVTLTASAGGTSYSWQPGNFVGQSINVAISQTTTYTVTLTSNCGTLTDSFKVNAIQPPNLTIAAIPDTICYGSSAILSASGATEYLWSTGQTSSTINTTDTISVATTFTVTVSNYGYCPESATQTVYLKNIKTGLVLNKDSICAGTMTSLTASGGQSYKWSNNTSASTDTITLNKTTPVTVVITTACGKYTLTDTVHVIPLPAPMITGPANVCKDSSATLTATGGTKYIWSTNATTTSITINKIMVSPAIYSVIAYNGVCYGSTTFSITLYPPPVITITKDTNICTGQSITLQATGGGTYKWSTSSTYDTTMVSPTSTTSYKVTVDSTCINSASTTVNVDAPSLFVSSDTTIYIGDTALLLAFSQSPNTTYTWQPNNYLSCNTCPAPLANPPQTTTYTVLSVDGKGCTVDKIVTVYVEPHCYDFVVPNVFTPNGDGINDQLVIKELEIYENVDYSDLAYSITIYDRWGKVMYKSTNPAESWDGNNMSGAKASDGVYFYIITSSCQNNGQAFTYDKKGFVQLIR